MFESNDILLFTETWSNEHYDHNVDGFNYYILHRYAQRDSGGVIVYISDKFISRADDMLLKTVDDSHDNILSLKSNGSVFGLQNDLILCLRYNIPSAVVEKLLLMPIFLTVY